MKSGDVDRLIGDLRGADSIRRDAASARLRVIGAAAVERLGELVRADVGPSVRQTALATLDGIDDPHVVPIAIHALTDADLDVRLAAITTLRGWITRENGTRALESLSGVALDRTQPSEARLAALDALAELPASLVQPILEQAPDAAPPTRFADPAVAQDWVARHGDAPLTHLHQQVHQLTLLEGVLKAADSRTGGRA